MSTKQQTRKEIYTIRHCLTQGEIEESSKLILERLMKTPAFLEAKYIFSYAALPLEVQTYPIHEACRALGKKIAYPKVNAKTHEMNFYETDCFEELEWIEYGKMKLLEPLDKPKNMRVPENQVVMLVPGVAFDRRKNRLGYGGGFYDRYLSQYTQVYTIGLAMSFQIYKELPVESQDQVLNQIVTEKEWID